MSVSLRLNRPSQEGGKYWSVTEVSCHVHIWRKQHNCWDDPETEKYGSRAVILPDGLRGSINQVRVNGVEMWDNDVELVETVGMRALRIRGPEITRTNSTVDIYLAPELNTSI